jgi:Archaeal Peptidase A24 C-terminus Type II
VDLDSGVRLGIGAVFLALAAYHDVRTRRVSDKIWIALGSIGLGLVIIELVARNAPLEVYAVPAVVALLFYAIFFGAPLFEDDGFHARPVRLGLFVVAAILFVGSAAWAWQSGGSDAALYGRLVTMPVMILVYEGFYQLGLLHGGADTKGLIALTLLVPAYPDASPFPILSLDPRVRDALQAVFPFSLVVLVNAAVLFVAVPLIYLVWNAGRGDLEFPQALFGSRVPVDRIPKYAWLMERITDTGEHVLVLFPRRSRDPKAEADKLRALGITHVWVQPQVPFMVPLLAGFVLAFFVGNLLLGLLVAVLPHP